MVLASTPESPRLPTRWKSSEVPTWAKSIYASLCCVIEQARLLAKLGLADPHGRLIQRSPSAAQKSPDSRQEPCFNTDARRRVLAREIAPEGDSHEETREA